MELSRSAYYGALVVALISVGSILARSGEQLAGGEFKIAALLCLSGECAEWGENSLKGMQLAVEEINSAGGVLGRKLKLIVEDTQEASAPTAAVSAYRKVRLEPELNLVLGPTWSPAGLALAPILGADKEVLAISPSLGIAEYNESADNIFNVWPHDDISTRKLARFARQLGVKRAAVFSSQQPWEKLQGDVFEEEFKAAGGEISAKMEPLPNASDLKVEALRIFDSAPELIFFSITNRMGLAALELQRLGYSGVKMAVLLDETRLADARGALEECIFARYPEASSTFQERYRERYKEKPGITADTGYDSVWLYALAIRSSESFETDKIKAALSAQRLNGASGPIQFDSLGGVRREPGLFRVRAGEYEPLT